MKTSLEKFKISVDNIKPSTLGCVTLSKKGLHVKIGEIKTDGADHEEDWYVYDARTGEKVYVGPAPEHLFYAAETKEEAMVMIAKLCMRPNNTTKGRAIKLTHYVDLHKRLYGTMPEDIHRFVRTAADVPVTTKDEIIKILEEKGWKETVIPDPTLLPKLIRKKKE